MGTHSGPLHFIYKPEVVMTELYAYSCQPLVSLSLQVVFVKKRMDYYKFVQMYHSHLFTLS